MHSPVPSSLVRHVQNMPTTDLIRLVESPSSPSLTPGTSSVLMSPSPYPSFSSSSLAVSLGQCPAKHVYDGRKGKCTSVHSHSFADKALKFALARANRH